MNITKQWLEKEDACSGGYEWFYAQNKKDEIKVIHALIKEGHVKWANWTIVRRLKTKILKVKYAVYAAEQVIDIFEKKYPDDKRPRKAINAAKKYIKDPSKKNAADAAYDAAHAAAIMEYMDADDAAGDYRPKAKDQDGTGDSAKITIENYSFTLY